MSQNFEGYHEGPWPEGRPSEHFTFDDVSCNHCNRLPRNLQAVRNAAAMLEKVRVACGNQPISVHSWFRCPAHNKRIGGVSNSLHLRGSAIDIAVKNLTPRQVQAKLSPHYAGNGSWLHRKAEKFLRGFGRYPGFTHVDSRPGPPSTWNG